jgi:hypothetical protein
MRKLVFMAFGLAVLQVQPVSANEKPLIWQPTKNSETSYTARIGVRMPTVLAPAAGIEMGMVASSETGAFVDAPMAAWGNVQLREVKTTASTRTRRAGARLNPVNGSASLTMNYYEKHIATPTLDIERRSDYVVRYNGVEQEWKGLEANHSLRLSRAKTGSSAVATASSADMFSDMKIGVGLEQKLGDHLTVKALVEDRLGAHDRSATVRADYRFRW